MTTASCSVKRVLSVKSRTVAVNGVVISRAAISQETQNHPAPAATDAWKAAAQALAIRELLLQEARRVGIVPEPMVDAENRRETDEEALVRALIEQEVQTPIVSDAECRRYYANNSQRFRSPDVFEVSHILLAAAPTDKEVRLCVRQQAETLIAELLCNPAAWPALAKQYSACPSRDVGGNLGQIGPGQTVPEFEHALPTLTVGAVHNAPIESRYGFHIVRMDRHMKGREIPFEIVEKRIAAYLSEHVRRTAIRQYISLLAGNADIEGVDLAASNTPLVQ